MFDRRLAFAAVPLWLVLSQYDPAQADRTLVPKGHLTIAQRFIAGNVVLADDPSPVGADERCWAGQSSLRDSLP